MIGYGDMGYGDMGYGDSLLYGYGDSYLALQQPLSAWVCRTLVVMAGLRSGHPRAATDWIDREGGADHRGKPGDDDVRYRSTALWRQAVGERSQRGAPNRGGRRALGIDHHAITIIAL